ncbi:MAG: chitobiase/beta-hexosaminidase C-terminal domain-containing protein [Candidatus Omnitrophica bacterium]|nr:chitobiase/beta-hexosaminidase C-terminal domain-containing protein [Candidatus Omnitrophota bacterium]
MTPKRSRPKFILELIVIAFISPTLFVAESFALSEQAELQNRALAQKIMSRVKPGQEWITGGCMIVSVSEVEAIANGSKSGFDANALLWPDGIVPYSINPTGIDDGTIDSKGNVAMGRREAIRQALDAWEAAAAVTFIEEPYGNESVSNYIEFNDHPSLNNSQVGMWPFPVKQKINITSWLVGVIVHEVGHALGLKHEQSRDDRDTFVTIIEDNIIEGKEHNFLISDTNNPGTYDFDSIMHYRHNAFGKNGQTTIDPLPPNQGKKFTMGTALTLSNLDKAGMAAMYGELTPTSAPGSNPPSGNYDSPVQFGLIIIPGIDQGTTRYFYTLDGSEPTTQSNEYFSGDVLSINSNTTVKYFALQQQHSPSITVSVNYTFTNATPMVETPVINPNSGSHTAPVQVTMTSNTPGAEIHYAFGGTIPTQNSPLYSGPLNLTTSSFLSARAFKAGYTPSGVANADLQVEQLTLTAPSLYPNSGEYPSPLSVYMETTIINGKVYYTLDGTDPDQSDNLFVEPVTLTQDTTVKARVYLDGPYNPSNIVTNNYTVIPTVGAPIINPNGGNHSGSVEVSLSLPAKGLNLENAIIRYTTNGAYPTQYSNEYTAPFTLGIGNHTVRAQTFYPGLSPSTVTSANFTVYDPSPTLDTPEFFPRYNRYADSVEVTIENLTEDADVYYTIGDNMAPANPTQSDMLYTGPFTLGLTSNVGDTWFIRAKAFKGIEESSVIQKNYEVFDPGGFAINPPTFDPDGGLFYNPITVDISTTTTPPNPGIYGSIRFYNTIDGTDPFVPDPPTTGGNSINLSGPAVLKSIGEFIQVYATSDITTATYEFMCATPTIETQPGKGIINHIGSATVVMSSTTTGGGTVIRYATGGVEPTETSTVYTEPIEIGPGTHIFKAKTYRNTFEDSDTAVASFIVEETPEAPMILTDPMDQTVDAYTDVMFTVEASGVPNPSYAWYYNGVKLGGENDTTLFLYNVQVAQAGEYYAVATNDASSATSDSAMLVVNQVNSPTPTDTLPPTETFTPSETPTGTLPTATFTPTPTDTTDGVTNTPTASETPTETVEPMATVAILSASQDNTIYEDSADLSNGLGPIFNAGRNGSNGNFMLRRALIAFDVASTIPAGATINRVTLTLRVSKENSGMNTFSLHPLQADWGEGDSSEDQGMGTTAQTGDATWMHRFYDTDQWTNMGADFDANPSAMASVDETGSYDWGSTTQMVADVQSWLDNPSTNYGWAIVGDESGATTKNVKQFDSKDNPTEANRPMLAVEYLSEQQPTATPTETATPTPTDTMEGVTESPTPVDTASIEDTDTNGDGVINEFDLLNVLKYWKQEVGP